MKRLYSWHGISSAVCLIGMLLFSITGITLNHPGSLSGVPEKTTFTATLPAELRNALTVDEGMAPLPKPVRSWLSTQFDHRIPPADAEWDEIEIYLPLPRPGGDAWLAIDRASGEIEYELTDRGLVPWLNDLHKGRNSGAAWSLFIDVFALASVFFSLTGLFILWMHARQRPLVWPLVALGAILPALIIFFFVH